LHCFSALSPAGFLRGFTIFHIILEENLIAGLLRRVSSWLEVVYELGNQGNLPHMISRIFQWHLYQ
jgi:hypothetical protein